MELPEVVLKVYIPAELKRRLWVLTEGHGGLKKLVIECFLLALPILEAKAAERAQRLAALP